MGAAALNERAFDERYRHWARRSGGLFTEASRYIPGGAGSSARTVKFGWETVPQYIEQLDHDLGVNVGNLIGHSAVRYYVMGDD